jgi:phosphoribosyl-AMP cyclohydrolase
VNRPSAETPARPRAGAVDDPPFLAALKWTADGLVPAIVQEVETGEVLMMAWMDEHALRRTFETGQTHFYSRSRRAAWHKGATSGHVQEVTSIFVDCDADVVLIKARQVGGACHEGYRSCFARRVGPDGRLELVASPVFEAEAVYGPRAPDGADRGPGGASV